MILHAKLQGDSENSIVWSTFPILNQLAGAKLRPGTIQTLPKDMNRDGKMDTFTLRVTLPLKADEKVTSMEMIALFTSKLRQHANYDISSLVYVTHIANALDYISSVTIAGDLDIVQRAPLTYRAPPRSLQSVSEPVINASSIDSREYLFRDILHRNSLRNASSRLVNIYTTHDRQLADKLEVTLHVHIPLLTIEYWTGFWELVKWGWVQYLSILVIFIYVMDKVRYFVFANILINTVPRLDPHLVEAIDREKGTEMGRMG